MHLNACFMLFEQESLHSLQSNRYLWEKVIIKHTQKWTNFK